MSDTPKCSGCGQAVCGLVLIGELYFCADCINKCLTARTARITDLEADNKRLQDIHDSELGVCQKYCDVVLDLQADLKLAADTAHGWQMKALELEAERAKFKTVSEKLKDAHLERDREEGEWKMAEAIRLALAALAPTNPSVAEQPTKEQPR